jgi:hypothetical protein
MIGNHVPNPAPNIIVDQNGQSGNIPNLQPLAPVSVLNIQPPAVNVPNAAPIHHPMLPPIQPPAGNPQQAQPGNGQGATALESIGLLNAIRAQKVQEELGPAIPEHFKEALEDFYQDKTDHSKAFKELKAKLRPSNTLVGSVPKCNPVVYSNLGFYPGRPIPRGNRTAKAARNAQGRDAQFQSLQKAIVGLNTITFDIMQHADMPQLTQPLNDKMGELFGGIAAIYAEVHTIRRKILLDALPYAYREALRPIATNMVGTLLFRQSDSDLTTEMVANNKRFRESQAMLRGTPNTRIMSSRGRGGNGYRPYAVNRGNHQPQNQGFNRDPNYGGQYSDPNYYDQRNQDFRNGPNRSRPPNQNRGFNNRKQNRRR